MPSELIDCFHPDSCPDPSFYQDLGKATVNQPFNFACSPPRDLPDPGVEPRILRLLLHCQAGSLPLVPHTLLDGRWGTPGGTVY